MPNNYPKIVKHPQIITLWKNCNTTFQSHSKLTLSIGQFICNSKTLERFWWRLPLETLCRLLFFISSQAEIALPLEECLQGIHILLSDETQCTWTFFEILQISQRKWKKYFIWISFIFDKAFELLKFCKNEMHYSWVDYYAKFIFG